MREKGGREGGREGGGGVGGAQKEWSSRGEGTFDRSSFFFSHSPNFPLHLIPPSPPPSQPNRVRQRLIAACQARGEDPSQHALEIPPSSFVRTAPVYRPSHPAGAAGDGTLRGSPQTDALLKLLELSHRVTIPYSPPQPHPSSMRVQQQKQKEQPAGGGSLFFLDRGEGSGDPNSIELDDEEGREEGGEDEEEECDDEIAARIKAQQQQQGAEEEGAEDVIVFKGGGSSPAGAAAAAAAAAPRVAPPPALPSRPKLVLPPPSASSSSE